MSEALQTGDLHPIRKGVDTADFFRRVRAGDQDAAIELVREYEHLGQHERASEVGRRRVALAAAGTALHSTVTLPGTPESTGAVLSLTVITWLWLDELPQRSVAVHVRCQITSQP